MSWKGRSLNIVAGIAFGLAWWLMIDAAASAAQMNEPIRMKFIYMLPGICNTISLVMVNVVDWSILQGFTVDDSVVGKAKCWLLLAFVLGFSSFFSSIIIMAMVYGIEANTGSLYGGIAIVVQNFLIILSTALFRAGQNAEEINI